jgi:hypothetical protein
MHPKSGNFKDEAVTDKALTKVTYIYVNIHMYIYIYAYICIPREGASRMRQLLIRH